MFNVSRQSERDKLVTFDENKHVELIIFPQKTRSCKQSVLVTWRRDVKCATLDF